MEPRESATGTLQKSPAVNLFVYGLEKRLTGVMQFAHGNTWIAVTLRDGWVYGVESSDQSHSLSQVLEDEQLLPKGVGDSSFAAARAKGIPHGQHLVDSGILSKEKLAQALRSQLLRKLPDVFLLPDEATFSFVASEVIISSDSVSLDPYALAWQGLRQRPPWNHIKALMDRVGALRLQLAPRAAASRFGFTGEELVAFQQLQRGPLSVSELVATRVIGANPAQVFAYALIICKSVTLVAAAPAASPDAVTAAPLSPRSTVHHTPRSMPVGATTPRSMPVQATTPRSATVHPVGAERDVTAVPSARPPAVSIGAASMPPPSLSAHDLLRVRKIQERAKTIEKLSYFAMLEIGTDASSAAVGEAYFALAKEWHPDRLPAALQFVRADCAKVFSHLTEAQRTLVDPAKRAEYVASMKQGIASPEDQRKVHGALEAVAHFQRAEVYIKARDWMQAQTLLRIAVELDPSQADYLAALAWADSQLPEGQSKSATDRLIATLSKAISMNEKCEKAYVYRAALYKRLDNQRAAYKDLVTVTELNPRNIDAAREVRLFNLRGKPSSIPPSSSAAGSKEAGLLSKFFKK